MLRMSDMSESELKDPRTRPAPADTAEVAAEAGAGDLAGAVEGDGPRGCEDLYAPHDLAALREGHLSSDGIRRLATHVRRCATCQIVVATVVAETTRADSTDTQVTGRRTE
jgi:hypothetical protein